MNEAGKLLRSFAGFVHFASRAFARSDYYCCRLVVAACGASLTLRVGAEGAEIVLLEDGLDADLDADEDGEDEPALLKPPCEAEDPEPHPDPESILRPSIWRRTGARSVPATTRGGTVVPPPPAEPPLPLLLPRP